MDKRAKQLSCFTLKCFQAPRMKPSSTASNQPTSFSKGHADWYMKVIVWANKKRILSSAMSTSLSIIFEYCIILDGPVRKNTTRHKLIDNFKLLVSLSRILMIHGSQLAVVVAVTVVFKQREETSTLSRIF